MKNNIIFWGILLCLFSCTNKVVESDGSKFNKITRALTSEEQLAIESIKEEFKEWASGDDSRSFSPAMSMRKNLSELDRFKLSTIPFYDFDAEKFYANPSPEALTKCMIPSSNINIFTERDGDLKFCFSLKKENDMWKLDKYIENWGNIISWLPDSLMNADSKKCKIFIHGNREYLTYKKNGDDLYFRITGERILTETLCEQFVEEYNQWQKNMQFTKEHPEMFPTSK